MLLSLAIFLSTAIFFNDSTKISKRRVGDTSVNGAAHHPEYFSARNTLSNKTDARLYKKEGQNHEVETLTLFGASGSPEKGRHELIIK